MPIFAALLAVMILGGHFRAYHLTGLGLVLGGIAMAERFGEHRRMLTRSRHGTGHIQ